MSKTSSSKVIQQNSKHLKITPGAAKLHKQKTVQPSNEQTSTNFKEASNVKSSITFDLLSLHLYVCPDVWQPVFWNDSVVLRSKVNMVNNDQFTKNGWFFQGFAHTVDASEILPTKNNHLWMMYLKKPTTVA